MRQAIVELEVRCILPLIGVLKLESVIFVEELEVPFSTFGDCGVVSIKGQLSVKRPQTQSIQPSDSTTRTMKRIGRTFRMAAGKWVLHFQAVELQMERQEWGRSEV